MIYQWFKENKYLFQKLKMSKLEKQIVFQKFEKDKDLTILHEYTKHQNNQEALAKIEQEMLKFLDIKNFNKKYRQKAAKKKEILQGIEKFMGKKNAFGIN